MAARRRVMLTRPQSLDRSNYGLRKDKEAESVLGGEECSASSSASARKEKNAEEKTPSFTPPIRGGVKKEGYSSPGEQEKERTDALLAEIAVLSSAQRKELLARLALSEGAPKAGGRDLDLWAEAVYSALGDALGGASAVGSGPLLIRRQLAVSSSWAPVEDFMSRSRFSEATVQERSSVYHMLAGLLVSYAKEASRRSGAPLTGKLVASCASNIASVFEQAFPGYLAAGLGRILVGRLTERREG